MLSDSNVRPKRRLAPPFCATCGSVTPVPPGSDAPDGTGFKDPRSGGKASSLSEAACRGAGSEAAIHPLVSGVPDIPVPCRGPRSVTSRSLDLVESPVKTGTRVRSGANANCPSRQTICGATGNGNLLRCRKPSIYPDCARGSSEGPLIPLTCKANVDTIPRAPSRSRHRARYGEHHSSGRREIQLARPVGLTSCPKNASYPGLPVKQE